MIAIKNLTYSYDSSNPMAFPDWSLAAKEHCLILGNSGCGKTTLLHLLGGLLSPKSGEISLAGTQIEKLKGSSIDHFRSKHIGFIFQKAHLINALTVEENLYLAQYLAGIKKNKQRVSEVLESLDMIEKRKSKVYELSQGQAQRVTIARAVLNGPKVILADEPTSSLDDENTSRVIDTLLQQADLNGASLIIATHDQRLKEQIPNQFKL
ncbi:MAG: ATP-binding cassette domain-containing protein [Bacteroidota bacterium]